MNRLTRFVSIAFLLCTSALMSNTAFAVDSFFDVFFEVGYDEPSKGVLITANGEIRYLGKTSRTVDIEIVALSLTSAGSGKPDSTRKTSTRLYTATLKYNIGSSGLDGVRQRAAVSNIGSSGQDGVRQREGVSNIGSSGLDGYAELDIVCKTKDRETECTALSSKPLSEKEYIGHVTLLR